MTIDEAIRVLTEMLDIVYNSKSPEGSRALKLGIEALKEIKASRTEDYIGDTGLLPGETEA